jgi:phage protein U
MLIGSWGSLVFEVSGIGALTFSEMTQDTSGRWVSHETINTAPLPEFLGPKQDEVEIKIILTKMFGTDPRAKYESLRQAVRKGQNFPLILKGTPLSNNLWYIEKISGVSSTFAAGDILWTELVCNFKEYR